MYAKVFRQMYDGTLATNGPWEALVTFQQLLVLANDNGEVDMTASAIARTTTIPLNIIERGLGALCAPDPESRTPDEEGRRIVLLSEHRAWGWRIVNYLKYRAIQKEAERREYHRRYYHEVRKRAVELNTSQQASTDSTVSTDTEAEEEAEAEAVPPAAARPPRAAKRPSVVKPDSVDQQVWDDWLSLRKAKRAPVTETVLDGAIEESGKAGMPLCDFLRAWCRRGTQGFEAAWLKPNERGHGPPSRKDTQLETAALMTGARKQQPGEVIDVTPRIIPS